MVGACRTRASLLVSGQWPGLEQSIATELRSIEGAEMKRLLLLLCLAFPSYAYATVWQLSAVDKDFPSRVGAGQFVENRGVLEAWHLSIGGYELRSNPADCGYLMFGLSPFLRTHCVA